MPTARPNLSVAAVRRHVDEHCFPTERRGRVGAELEWLAVDVAASLTTGRYSPQVAGVESLAGSPPGIASRPFGDLRSSAGDGNGMGDDRANLERTSRALDRCHLPGGSSLTVEPGGQVELSSRPAEDLGLLCTGLSSDLREVQEALSDEGIGLVGAGIDPDRSPRRILTSPRYQAMEAFFDGGGEHAPGAGRTMMCNTASIQLNLDTGGDEGTGEAREHRWTLAHHVSPVLAAAFANSPVAMARPTGWRSTRLAAWQGIDTSRTASAHRHRGCVDDWATFALDARVMMIRTRDDDFVVVDDNLPFGKWLSEGHELGYPTGDDLAYHLTTLFPPVRPKGWLELRSIDAVPDPWWRAAVAVGTAVLDDPEAAEHAARATAPTIDCWDEAGRWGMAHPGLADAAQRMFPPAMAALERLGADAVTVSATEDFYERFVARGRCPADDLTARCGAGAAPAPAPDESPFVGAAKSSRT